MRRLGAKATGVGDVANVIDGDPNTFWLAGDVKDLERKHQSVAISFPRSVQFSGFVIMPRQNHREHEGDVRDYLIEISDDGTTWSELKRGSLASTFEPQSIELGKTASTRFLRFTALSGFGIDKVTALAEIAIVYTGPKLPDDDLDLEYKRVKSASPDIDEGTNKDDKKVIKP
jgi:hypothetical protein